MKNIIIAIAFIFTYQVSAQTQMEMNNEAAADFKSTDSVLNATYKSILMEYKADTVFIKNMKIAQRLWIQLRDAEINMKYPAENVYEEYGSMYPLCYFGLKKELTQNRIDHLKVWLLGLEPEMGCIGSVKAK
jgi:uncharacterized protein YecT (DUF1311 family)